MGFRNCQQVAGELEKFRVFESLPERISDFVLQRCTETEGLELIFARYINDSHRGLELIYTMETGDFVPVKSIGLHRFREDCYYCDDERRFFSIVSAVLPKLLQDMESVKEQEKYSAQALEIGLDKWRSWERLPLKFGNFELFITPDKPLRTTNGAEVIIDYSDFDQKNQLVIFYNEYRNEIYGELRKNGVIYYTGDFDVRFDGDRGRCGNVTFWKKVDQVLEEQLEVTLAKFSK